MRRSAILPIGLVLVAAGVLAMSLQRFDSPWSVNDPRGWAGGQDPYLAAAAIAAQWGAPQNVQNMLRYQLATESRGQAAASLGISYGAPPWVASSQASLGAKMKEARAAADGFARLSTAAVQQWTAAGWTAPAWSFGSGGLYGLLPSSGMITVLRARPSAAWITEKRASPWDIFDPVRGTALYVDFIRRVTRLKGVKRWIDIKFASASLNVLWRPEETGVDEKISTRAPIIAARAGLDPAWPMTDITDADRAWLNSFKVMEVAYA